METTSILLLFWVLVFQLRPPLLLPTGPARRRPGSLARLSGAKGPGVGVDARPGRAGSSSLRRIAAHQNTASDLNTFTDTFPNGVRMKFVVAFTRCCVLKFVEVW